MEILPRQPSSKGGSDRFTGDVWIDRIAGGEESSRIRVNVVRFAPGARNAWHAHAVGQTLHVTEGVGRVQARGGAILEIRAGDTIYTAPGEWHWHGAAPDQFMSHLAIWEVPADGPESEWGEQVADEDYAAEPGSNGRVVREHLGQIRVRRIVRPVPGALYSRGSTGSLSRASTPNTHSWIRRSGSFRMKRSSASTPSANSRWASDRFPATPRPRRRSRCSGRVYSGP